MAQSATPAVPGRVYLWWLVLGLIGLDYFSTLAYLPSLAVEAAGPLAPLGAGAVVLVTLLGALPIYLYVVGRSPHGAGATGLLERLVHGWTGKFLILVLLGFVATDFITTRSLSLADATVHLVHNPYFQDHSEWVRGNQEKVKTWLPAMLRGSFLDFWNEQLVITVLLAVVVFAFWALLNLFRNGFMHFAALLIAVYVALTLLIIGSGLVYLANHRDVLTRWAEVVPKGISPGTTNVWALIGLALLAAFTFFPHLVLGLSGFELTMASASLVRGQPNDLPDHPAGRIRNTRKLMLVSALIMSVCLLGSVTVVTFLVPQEELKSGTTSPASSSDAPPGHSPRASDRALSYLAHGGPVKSGASEETINPVFGPAFGTAYDVVTILVLCLAGVSVTLGMRDLLPHYLARYGMQLEWARKLGVITHLFNLAIILVTLIFHASVQRQQWAYGTSVMVLLTAAALAATLEVRSRHRRWLGYFLSLPFGVFFLFFVFLTLLLLWINASGLAIALLFVVILLGTAITSRWLRSTELRFEGFEFTDDHSRRRWEEIRNLDFQVLVPHRPDTMKLLDKDREVRTKHRLANEVPIIFIEARLGDPSEFYQKPTMHVLTEEGKEVIRVTHCTSVAHVLAVICLEFRHVGRPPEIYFDWSNESPHAANLDFLLMGQGNIPWMVHDLIRKAERDPQRQPRVVIG
jgi:hypothetical protein